MADQADEAMSKEAFSTEKTIKTAAKGNLSRRQFNTLLSATGVSLFAMPVLMRSTSAQKAEPMYFAWGGYDIPELLEEYNEKHGAYPDTGPYASSSETLTKVRVGFVVDVMHPCNTDMDGWIGTGVIQAIDIFKLSHWNDMIPSLQSIGEKDGERYFAAMEWGQTSIAYRPDLVDLNGEEESQGILWDERCDGRIGVIANEGDAWWIAALCAGIPVDEIGTDENIGKVVALVRSQQSLILAYFDEVTTREQSLASGKIVAAMTWNEAPTGMTNRRVPIRWTAPKEGALTWVCGASISWGAPRVDRAHDVINPLISPQSGNFIINEYGYGHSNLKSPDTVSREGQAELGLPRNPANLLLSGKSRPRCRSNSRARTRTRFRRLKPAFRDIPLYHGLSGDGVSAPYRQPH